MDIQTRGDIIITCERYLSRRGWIPGRVDLGIEVCAGLGGCSSVGGRFGGGGDKYLFRHAPRYYYNMDIRPDASHGVDHKSGSSWPLGTDIKKNRDCNARMCALHKLYYGRCRSPSRESYSIDMLLKCGR